ncbi:dipeptidyl peptidase 3-like isoform X1 [Centruroides vittatus]|uniref:dipeptidyl peptidase 3-like isoform X1 n=1 Tax=Centruroides vittatus TaxID=120091 RepID=UPI00350FCD3A
MKIINLFNAFNRQIYKNYYYKIFGLKIHSGKANIPTKSLKQVHHQKFFITKYSNSAIKPENIIQESKMSDYVFPNDQPVVLLDCEKAFSALTNQEKLYAHYLSRAAWYGGLIVLMQTSPESPLIFAFLYKLFKQQSIEELKQIAIQECEFSDDDFTALLVYFSGILTNMGNYKGFGDTKFVPDLPKAKFEKLLKASMAYKNEPELLEMIWKNCSESIYSLNSHEKQLGFQGKGITTYFSGNCTKEDADIVTNFLKEKNIEAYNSRVFKTVDDNGISTYEIRLASVASTEDNEDSGLLGQHIINGCKFVLTRGDYSKLLKRVNDSLQKAKIFSANEDEKKMLDKYVQSFRTGSLDAHKDGSRYWIKDKGPVVETYIGFIETYRDPAGMRGEFEGFVAVVNKNMSAKFNELVNNSTKFLPLLPWPAAYEKDKFLKPDFTSLDVLTFAASDIPVGICIPNYDEIRQDEGFKNVSLGNVLLASFRETSPNFLNKSDQELFSKHRVGAFEVQVGLHELLGHGSGKLFRRDKDGSFNFDKETVLHTETKEKISSWYDEGDTFYSKFAALGSSYEECRAECVGLYLSVDQEVLKIFGYTKDEAEDVTYMNWLGTAYKGLEGLQMYEPNSKSWLQAHCQARYVILQVLLEAGNGFVNIEKTDGADGKPDLLFTMDRTKIKSVGMPAIETFLRKLQVYKAIADVDSATKMYEKYSAVSKDGPFPFLNYREIVMARKKPRKMFVQSNTILEGDTVNLKNYEASPIGLIQSWVDRFKDDQLEEILIEEWQKDKCHFKYS